MSDTALVKRPVVDDLAIKVEAFRNGQLAKREKEKAPLKRWVLIESFLCLAERYFGATREFIKNLLKEERAELLNQVFEEAKRRLLWQAPLIYIPFVVSIGLIPLMSCFYYNKDASFPAFKLRRLYKWYMENYGADDLEKAVKSGDFDKEIGSNALVKAATDALVKKPEPHEVVLPALAEGVLEASESVAKSIDFSPAMLIEIQLLKFLKDRNIKVFKLNDVCGYLKSVQREKWSWRPLREKDKTKSSSKENPYSKLIPPRASAVVEEIARLFGDKVSFWVTHYVDRPSYHFIGVWMPNMDIIIFNSWHDDELKQPGA